MRKKNLQSQSRLEYISQKIESTLSSARDANKILTEMMKNRIKECLQRSLEKKEYIKCSGQILNSVLQTVAAIIPNGFGKKLGEVSIGIIEEQRIIKDRLEQKFDRAINNLDSMPANRLIGIMKILKKHELEIILDHINVEPIQAIVTQKTKKSNATGLIIVNKRKLVTVFFPK